MALLKRRAAIAMVWNGGDIVLRQGVQFVTTMALARLLAPADFGMVAMLALFVGAAFILMDGGLSAALIQHRDVDHTDESTVFWFNLGVGVLLTLALVAIAPMVADFYGAPILKPLTRAMSLVCLLGSIGAIHSALLSRQLNFRTQAKAGAIAALLSGVVAITLALRGYGVWALAAQSLVMTGAMSLFLWLFNPWRPAWTFSATSLRKLLGFGGYHLGSSFLEMVYSRLYTLFIGRLFGARDLGLYANAEICRMIPGGFIASLVSRVALPMFSEVANDPVKLRRGVQLSIRGMMLINAPAMLIMSTLAEPIILVIFGKQWVSAAPILQVLCLVGVLYPLQVINLQALMAQGHAGLMFRGELIKKIVGVAFLVAGIQYGVMGVAWGQVAFSICAFGINTHYSKRLLGFGAVSQLRECAPSILVATLVAAGLLGIDSTWVAPPAVQLVVLGAIGGLTYLGIISIARINAFRDVMMLIRHSRLGKFPS